MRKLLKLFNWLRFLYYIVGAISGLILGVIGNYLSDSGKISSLKYLIPFFLILLTFIIVIEVKRKRLIEVNLKVDTGRSQEEKERNARKGLIASVSLYNPINSESAKKLSPEEWAEAAIKKNHAVLDLENSNLQPVIESIVSHSKNLEHCWLIGTMETQKVKGSILYQEVLIEYLKQKKGITCNFHHGEKYAIPLIDDALVCEKSYKMVRKIYEEALALGLTEKDIIVDFTGGVRSIMAGQILSCLHADNDIQLMGTKYDVFCRPEGPPFPNIYFFPT